MLRKNPSTEALLTLEAPHVPGSHTSLVKISSKDLMSPDSFISLLSHLSPLHEKLINDVVCNVYSLHSLHGKITKNEVMHTHTR